MTVKDLVMYSTNNMKFKLMDATANAHPGGIFEGDRDSVRVRYGRNTLVRFEVTGKDKMTLFIK